MRDLTTVDMLILGGTVLPMNENMDVIADGGIAIADGLIAAVGTRALIETGFMARRTIDASDRLVMPGLINTHTHTPMTILRGFKDDMALEQWLDSIWPWEHENVNPTSVKANSRLAMAEMIGSGITTFSDMYFYGTVTARLASEVGMRALVCEPYADGGPCDFDYMVSATARLMEEFAGDPLVIPTVGPHSLYALSREQLQTCVKLAGKYQSPVTIHLAETRDETATIQSRYGMRPVAFADSLGLLTARTIAGHCVQVDDSEIELLAEREVGVAHMPQSNMKLSSGVAPVPAMLSSGVKVGLGTDGAASNNILDILEEMKAAALIHKVTSGDASAVDAITATRMATIEGARALGLEGSIGSLEPGKKADVITVNLQSPHMTPCYNPFSHIAYVARGSDVETAIIDGRVVMEDRQLLTIDVDEAVRDVRDLARSLG
ncbi:MAG: amidohydrolase [Candidatus Geothermincolia bacterium]